MAHWHRTSTRQIRRIRRPQPLDDDEATWESYLKNWTSPDFLDRMGTYEGPTTLIVGESDPFVTAEYLGDTLAALKNGNLKTVHGKAGHYPMVENAPETVALSEQSLY